MHIPEADFELLIRILSEARSRATELAASIGVRLGTEHRLSELANAASWRIENMMREVRSSAMEDQENAGGSSELQGAPQSQTLSVNLNPADQRVNLPPEVQAMAAFAAQAALVDPDHWLPMFVEDLTWQLRTSGGISFDIAERLLQQRKDDFLKDFLTARRMYRTYPHLFPELRSETARPTGPQPLSRKAASNEH